MNLFNCLGLGIVTATKDTNTEEAMVYLPGLFPHAEGRANMGVSVGENRAFNDAGDEVTSTVMSSNSIPMKWINFSNNNRMTSPDVREGSMVAVYNVQGSSQYFWSYVGVNQETFRLETVLYGYSANPNVESDNRFDINNFYVFKVDTRDGKVSLRTSKRNKEKTRFEIEVDAKEGRITTVGDHGSYLCFDDVGRSLTYTNKDGSLFNIEKNTLTSFIPSTINLETKTLNMVTDTLNLKSKTMNVATTTLNLNTTNLNVEAANTQWVGPIHVLGAISAVGGMSVEGSLEATGVIHSDTDVTSRVSLNSHKTSGVVRGGDISDVPV